MNNPGIGANDAVLVSGASGVTGSRIIPELRASGMLVRMMVRIPEKGAVRIACSEKTDAREYHDSDDY